MSKGFDCSEKITAEKAKTLRNQGFEYAARYLGNSWKTFDAAEAKIIQDAGLKLISIYEKNPTYLGYFTKKQGMNDANEAMAYANTVGQPKGSAIYFTVDYEALPSHMPAILTYLDGIRATLKDYKIGLYGSYNVMVAVKGKVDYYWQTYAWSYGRVADFLHMYQYENDVREAGVDIDLNEINKEPGHWVTSSPENTKVFWDGVEMHKGQIGRITILKPINLWRRNGDQLEMVRILKPGEVYRVYSYDQKHGGQYGVGAGLYITKMDGYIKYETPSKAKLKKLNG